MRVVQAQIQTVEEIYKLVWTAVATKQPIEATYQGLPRLFCPHRLGRNREGRLRVLCYQYGGESQSGLQPEGSPANWALCCAGKAQPGEIGGRCLAHSASSFAPGFLRGQKPISTQRIIPNAIHKKDIEEVAPATVGQESFSMSQWNADYAARDERGAPRGRKSVVGHLNRYVKYL